jgi:hypothetical protein
MRSAPCSEEDKKMNRRLFLYSLLISLAGLSVTAFAQGCPYGIPSAGNPGCVPPDQSYQSTAEIPVRGPEWQKTWGAIAFGRTSITGTSTGLKSKRKAEKEALNQCRAKGGSECRISLSYQNQCAAIAWGESSAATQSAESIEVASALAMKNCSKSTTDCQIYYSNCSDPIRIQ